MASDSKSYVNLSGYQIPKTVFDDLSPIERHKLMMSLRHLEKTKVENNQEKYLSDYDILKKKYQFVHDVSTENNSLLQKYYKSICNKYVICYLDEYKVKKIGLRWRTEEEIVSGKGHIICSSNECDNTNLNTYEFMFRYSEEGIEKETKVKLRACMDCAYKINYRAIKKYLKKNPKEKVNKEKRKKENCTLGKRQRCDKGHSKSESNKLSSDDNGEGRSKSGSEHGRTRMKNEINISPFYPFSEKRKCCIYHKLVYHVCVCVRNFHSNEQCEINSYHPHKINSHIIYNTQGNIYNFFSKNCWISLS
ncbi:hypothetical protein, conserved [Plasmodium gonderi]|uniref:Protein FRA10AC1 n=1 Tax=Plasmodium gonderi TaxID=77519 RepID=A0A1Y1JBB3_PLAGO|nr:hypothetical protein, conserved [Plasmodium gonderi]GAW78978.1 hypothetical protein, conserved [Plasmodium gonderi]